MCRHEACGAEAPLKTCLIAKAHGSHSKSRNNGGKYLEECQVEWGDQSFV